MSIMLNCVADTTRSTIHRSIYRSTSAVCYMEHHHCVSPAHMFYSRDTNCSRVADEDFAKRTRWQVLYILQGTDVFALLIDDEMSEVWAYFRKWLHMWRVACLMLLRYSMVPPHHAYCCQSVTSISYWSWSCTATSLVLKLVDLFIYLQQHFQEQKRKVCLCFEETVKYMFGCLPGFRNRELRYATITGRTTQLAWIPTTRTWFSCCGREKD